MDYIYSITKSRKTSREEKKLKKTKNKKEMRSRPKNRPKLTPDSSLKRGDVARSSDEIFSFLPQKVLFLLLFWYTFRPSLRRISHREGDVTFIPFPHDACIHHARTHI